MNALPALIAERKALVKRADAAEARVMKLEAAIRPFAKAGELFERVPVPTEYRQMIYSPLAGEEYSLDSSHLRAAHALLSENPHE